jgi:hypothetical protein
MRGRGEAAPGLPSRHHHCSGRDISMDKGFWIGVLLALVIWSIRRHRSPS